MKRPGLKFRLLLAPALALACSAVTAQGCGARRGNEVAPTAGQSQTPTQTPSPTPSAGRGAREQKDVTTGGGLEVIETGSQSKVAEAFVAVARDAQTYESIRKLHESLPALRPEFFTKNAVVAAFLGRRNTGGYSVGIARDAEGALRVSEVAPPKGAMVTMALTAPYRVVSFAHWPEQPVRLQLGEAWQKQSQSYRVREGEFTMTGGFAGVAQQFKFGGTVGVLRHSNLATFLFALKGEGEAGAARSLSDAATGTLDATRHVSIPQLDPGSFIHPPRRAMRAEGRFSAGDHRLTLKLDGTQPAVADGFGGHGTLEADAAGDSPPKSDDKDERM